MSLKIVVDQLKSEISKGLPGESAHAAMSPIDRKKINWDTTDAIRESAVAIVLFEKNDLPHCLLIQRTEYEGKHSGQMSFPGGKKDPEDIDLEYTARRECFEEIGIPVEKGTLLGELTSVFIPVSSFIVRPFLFFHDEIVELVPNEREVAEIVSFQLSDLIKENVISTMEIPLTNGTYLKEVPYFDLEEKKVWGATALILNEMRELLLRFYQK
jgi:8-oxo-dGTP pyrophosphatase MutT (NUDIX family)